MDSDLEDTEVPNNFSWHSGGRQIHSGPRNEDSTDSLNERKNSKGEAFDENLMPSTPGSTNHKALNPTQVINSSNLNSTESPGETGQGGATSTMPTSNLLSCDTNSSDVSKIISAYADVSNTDNDGNGVENCLPKVNVPEKIIFCFDVSEEEFYVPSKFNEISNVSTLNVIKQAIEIFIYSKHMIDKRHEFALVVVHQKAVWLLDFTNKPKDILLVLSELTETPSSDSFCLTSLFDVIKENVSLPVVEDSSVIPPPFVIRPILIYSRFRCVPKFYDGQESYHALMSSKYFSFDYIVIHESVTPESHFSDEIAKAFSEICTKSYSLKLHISRSATKFLHSMAKLLSHPLQRSASYELRKDTSDNREVIDSNAQQ